MGIQGLLPQLKSFITDANVQKYKSQKVAVDGYCWLHRAAYCCSKELVTNQATTKYEFYLFNCWLCRWIPFCMNLVRMLKHFQVIPVIVFDGARLPKKQTKEQERHDKRAENKSQAFALLEQGKAADADV